MAHCDEEQKYVSTANTAVSKEAETRLRPRKIANYKEQFDISSISESEDESVLDESYSATYGCCVLPNSVHDLRLIMKRCEENIKALEKDFFEAENEDASNPLPK
jgi:hypothetical protein